MAERIGIRELRQGLSAALRRVRTGETLEVTDRGRPVARIVPARKDSPFEDLIEQGLVRPRSRSGPFPAPLDVPTQMSSEEAMDILRGE
jgi:prevent-host-death family protein